MLMYAALKGQIFGEDVQCHAEFLSAQVLQYVLEDADDAHYQLSGDSEQCCKPQESDFGMQVNY